MGSQPRRDAGMETCPPLTVLAVVCAPRPTPATMGRARTRRRIVIDLEFNPSDADQVASVEELTSDVQSAVDDNGWYPASTINVEDQPT